MLCFFSLREYGTNKRANKQITKKKYQHNLLISISFDCNPPYIFCKRRVWHIPQVQVDGADVRNKLLGLEVKLTEVLNFKGSHLRTHKVLQEVVQHGDDPLGKEGVHKDALDF